MTSIFLIVIQVILSFFIASTLYLVAIYYLKISLSIKENNIENKIDKKHHFAIVFNDYINEDNLLEQIQFLNNQSYSNFSAYFFIDSPYVAENNMNHIRIIRPLQKRLGKFGLLNLSKNYFVNDTDAVLVLDPGAKLNPDYLEVMNNSLCEGYRVIQSNIQGNANEKKQLAYQVFAKRFYNLIDRKAHTANGLSSALWNQGFVIHNDLFDKLNFDSYTNSDKVLQAELITRSERVAYAGNARLTERAYSSDELLNRKKSWYQQYFFNYHLGFNLLLEGIKNANFEKILFGFNFMRPPLIVMLAASLTLAAIDIIWMPELAFFLWLAVAGSITSLLILSKPKNAFRYFKKAGNRLQSVFADPTKSVKLGSEKVYS